MLRNYRIVHVTPTRYWWNDLGNVETSGTAGGLKVSTDERLLRAGAEMAVFELAKA
jgi:hypothetical protein